MASQRFSPHDDIVAGDGRLHRYRLLVLGAGVGEVVDSVGGFLCDRARAGWEVSVLLTAPCDTRPLTILGIAARELDGDPGSVIESLSPGGALAVGVDLLTGDAGVRDGVSRMATRAQGEVTVWGRPAPAEIGQRFEPAAHPLSIAARAFKTCALRAAGRGDAVDPTETLYRLRGQSVRRLHSI